MNTQTADSVHVISNVKRQRVITSFDDMTTGDKTLMLIESSHLWHISKSLKFNIDYTKLLNQIRSRQDLLRPIYYANIIEREVAPIIQVVDFLSYNGYTTNVEYIDENDCEDHDYDLNVRPRMITDMLIYAYDANVKHVILITGNNSFIYPMKALQRLGVTFTVISTLWSVDQNNHLISLPKISPMLRREADCFIDLADVRHMISM